ncbi:MAG TPA: hypothetical protein VGO25_01760 [Rhodanobacteraceae bacterium]|nr:hypothetical protein [Rhodanobacteraceae bacterium]
MDDGAFELTFAICIDSGAEDATERAVSAIEVVTRFKEKLAGVKARTGVSAKDGFVKIALTIHGDVPADLLELLWKDHLDENGIEDSERAPPRVERA